MSIKNRVKVATAAAFLLFVAFITVCKQGPLQTVLPIKPKDIDASTRSDEPILPIPTEITLDTRKVSLGEKLFNDSRLSHDDTLSCASCHSLAQAGTDQKVYSVGIGGQSDLINTPTVFNAVYNFKQFWDGRAETLEAQIDGPTHSANEMGSSWDEISNKLSGDPEYVSTFRGLYAGGIDADSIRDAIATFERSLITPNSRFDKFLRGDPEAITKNEKEGYLTFKSVGCISCHQGVNAGGNLFQEFGVMGDYFKDRGNITQADLGRYNVTNQEYDRYVFKVPGLRNVSQTYPYFHDGSARTLEDAVSVMSKYQLGRKLSNREISLIVAFLKTLDVEYKRLDK